MDGGTLSDDSELSGEEPSGESERVAGKCGWNKSELEGKEKLLRGSNSHSDSDQSDSGIYGEGSGA